MADLLPTAAGCTRGLEGGAANGHGLRVDVALLRGAESGGWQSALVGVTLSDMRLLEREVSLASLAGYAREARRGDGRLVLVAGEAGVGKSALLERFQLTCPDARWSWGACDGLFTPRPLGPLFDLAGQLGGELLDLCRAGAARDELFRALLRQVSEPGTLDVVVVEDVHWADEATVDLLGFLGRRIGGCRRAARGHLPRRGPGRG